MSVSTVELSLSVAYNYVFVSNVIVTMPVSTVELSLSVAYNYDFVSNVIVTMSLYSPWSCLCL